MSISTATTTESTASTETTGATTLVKALGWMFLATPVVGVLYAIFIHFRVVVAGDALATARNVAASPSLMRVGVLVEVLMAVIGVAVGFCLYQLLRHVDERLALLALLFKIIECVLVAVMALISALLLLAPPESALVGRVIITHTQLYAIPMVFLGLSFALFFRLLRRSAYAPRGLAIFGMVAYVLILLYGLCSIVLPQQVEIVQMLFWGPSIAFELAFGGWLLVKGLKLESASS